jgi:hypothetical protein
MGRLVALTVSTDGNHVNLIRKRPTASLARLSSDCVWHERYQSKEDLPPRSMSGKQYVGRNLVNDHIPGLVSGWCVTT